MTILDFLYPKFCLECGDRGRYICGACLGKVGKRGWYGENCSVFAYEGVVRRAIIALKYKFALDVAGELAEAVVGRLREERLDMGNSILVPIPLHRRRENWRGFNQVEEVGRVVSEKMGWGFDSNALLRNLNTKAQVGLSARSRGENIKDAFGLNPETGMKNKTIIVFDDVWTTGSTMREAKKTLREGGVGRVVSLTIAK